MDFASQLRRVLQSLIVVGCPSVDQTALLLAMHRRTLNRRLNALGITFKQLLDETCFEIAQQLLRDTRMPMVDIAVSLNYASTSAFLARSAAGQCDPCAWRAAPSTINLLVPLPLPVRVAAAHWVNLPRINPVADRPSLLSMANVDYLCLIVQIKCREMSSKASAPWRQSRNLAVLRLLPSRSAGWCEEIHHPVGLILTELITQTIFR